MMLMVKDNEEVREEEGSGKDDEGGDEGVDGDR